jgi:hypothetical protein
MDHTLSTRIDAVILILDTRPPWWVRVVVRLWKRRLERAIP